MSYLLDKRLKRNSLIKYTTLVVLLFIFIYFKNGIFRGLSYFSHTVFSPVLVIGGNISEKLSNTSAYFYSKKSLLLQNENFKLRLNEEIAKMSNYNSILDENIKIKEILGRKVERDEMVLASILSKPNQSPYDTIIIDAGTKESVTLGQRVFALGDVPIGTIAGVYPGSSKVILFSSPGEVTDVVISGHDVSMQLVGRGGGNFEMVLPRDLILEKGTEVVLPGITPHTVATVETIISDPRDSFQKALLLSPVNIFELKFVEIEK